MRLLGRMVISSALAALASCGVELEHGLDERQANQLVAALEAGGVSADKRSEPEGGGYLIRVDRRDAARAFALLESRDLPRRSAKGLTETFAEPALLPSPLEERARYGAALAADLERTLETVPGVEVARVHLALPVEDPLAAPAESRARPTASVMVKAISSAVSEAEVRRLVAGAVPSLLASDVSVVVISRPASAAASPAPQNERLGPLRVARESRPPLIALATAGLTLILLLSLAWLRAALALARLRRN